LEYFEEEKKSPQYRPSSSSLLASITSKSELQGGNYIASVVVELKLIVNNYGVSKINKYSNIFMPIGLP